MKYQNKYGPLITAAHNSITITRCFLLSGNILPLGKYVLLLLVFSCMKFSASLAKFGTAKHSRHPRSSEGLAWIVLVIMLSKSQFLYNDGLQWFFIVHLHLFFSRWNLTQNFLK